MTGPAAGARAAAVRAPFAGRARRDIAFCVLTLPLILPGPVVGFAVTIALAQAIGPPWVADGNPSWLAMLTAVAVAVLTAALMVATGAARALAVAARRAAVRLLGEQLPPPPPRHARLGDGPGWRAMAYLMLKLPAGLAECYAVGIFWVAGLVNLTYPFWWLSFRNHSPGTRLSPVPVITPFDWFGTGGHFRVATFPGTFAAFGAGAVMLLAAPWVTRAVVAADRWLIRGLSQYIETRYAAQLLAGNPAGWATCSRTGWPTSASSPTRSAGSPRAAPRWTGRWSASSSRPAGSPGTWTRSPRASATCSR
jgi:hypothetical protein